MKKMIVLIIIISVLGVYSVSRAAKVNNGAGVQGAFGKMTLGLEYDPISNQKIEFDSGSSTEPGEVGPFPEPGVTITGGRFASTRVLLSGSVGLAPWVDLFIKLGFADAELTYQLNEGVGPPETITFEGNSSLAYGLGLKAAIGDLNGYQFYSTLQIFSSKSNGSYLVAGHAPEPTEAKLLETQIAFFAAKTLGMWTPYGGLKFSESMLEIDHSIPVLGGIARTHEKHTLDANVGIFVGTDVVLVPGTSANIEFRFVDEEALSLGLNWAF